MAVISQNLTIPAGLADGNIASASQITPLYLSLNGLVLPDSVFLGTLRPSFVDDTLTTLTIGGTVTKDWSLTTYNVPQLKSLMFLVPFSWDTGTGSAPTITYRLNGGAVSGTQATGTTAAGNGMIVGFVGARDSDTPRSMLLLQLDDQGGFRTVPATATLPAAALTSVGVTIATATTAVFRFKHVRFWGEG